MGRFSSGDVIDLPELHRRGLVKFPKQEEEIDEIDFTSDAPVVASENKSASSGVSDFLSDFSNIGASNINSNSPSDISKNEKSSDSENIDSVKLVRDLKWRIENNEYKIEQLIERLVALEKRLS